MSLIMRFSPTVLAIYFHVFTTTSKQISTTFVYLLSPGDITSTCHGTPLSKQTICLDKPKNTQKTHKNKTKKPQTPKNN